MEVATHQMEHCATPGISGTSEGQFGPREVPATIAKQSSGSIVMPPPSFPVDLSTPIRREAELESMSCHHRQHSGLVQRQLVQTSGCNTGYMREA